MKRLRVLIVDDDELARLALRRLLESQNYEIAGAAADEHAAIEEAARLNADVVLLDIRMGI
jgi:DNA-binding NarL/FixJ family response regulator